MRERGPGRERDGAGPGRPRGAPPGPAGGPAVLLRRGGRRPVRPVSHHGIEIAVAQAGLLLALLLEPARLVLQPLPVLRVGGTLRGRVQLLCLLPKLPDPAAGLACNAHRAHHSFVTESGAPPAKQCLPSGARRATWSGCGAATGRRPTSGTGRRAVG